MADMNEWNKKIIDEFRANAGVVGGQFAGAPMVLITTTGAKSGQQRTSPLVCYPEAERLVIFASKAGAPTNPDWYHNLMANPELTVEFGAETYAATASELHGAERDEVYAKQVERMPGFGEYAVKTAGIRVIPVLALTRNG